MVDWIKKYDLYIIIGLFLLLCLQTCSRCSKENTIQWIEMEDGIVRDSLIRDNNKKSRQIDSLTYELNKIRSQYENSKLTVESLKKDKEYLKEQNKTLNSNLKKTLDKNEKFE